MKRLVMLEAVHTHTHTHTQGNLVKRINKVENINLYINVYKTDQLNI